MTFVIICDVKVVGLCGGTSMGEIVLSMVIMVCGNEWVQQTRAARFLVVVFL
jgi:hypothetical protein